jgi:hypothetical protein
MAQKASGGEHLAANAALIVGLSRSVNGTGYLSGKRWNHGAPSIGLRRAGFRAR